MGRTRGPALGAELARAARTGLLPAGTRVIAAVSGGPDSTCLLHLLAEQRHRLGLSLEVAHFDHGLRGRASARDAAAVRAAAVRLGLPFHLGQGRTFTAQERRRCSLQVLARRQRLGFLLRLARRRRAVAALGHTADDQAETVLLRLLDRGAPAALAGIAPASHGGRIVHPLLGVRRRAVEAWLEARGIRARTDRSNLTRRYRRNRVRLDLLPLLTSEWNPRLVERLCRLAEIARRDSEGLDAMAAAVAAGFVPRARGGFLVPARILAQTPAAICARALLVRLEALAPADARFGSRHIEALLSPGAGQRRFDLPGGIAAQRDGAGLLVAPAGPGARRPAPGPLSLPVPGSVELPSGMRLSARRLRRPPGLDPRSDAAPHRALLDAAAVRAPLTVRTRLPGDRFAPLGLGAVKRLKDLLIDEKIPASSRGELPVVCDREGIVWVAGVRIADRARVTRGTKTLLSLEWTGAATARERRGSD